MSPLSLVRLLTAQAVYLDGLGRHAEASALDRAARRAQASAAESVS